MPSDMEFVVPTSVAEAVSALAQDGAMAVGGGTSVALLMKNRFIEPRSLVYLGRVQGLSGISLGAEGDLVIGATTTLRELVDSDVVRSHEPVLATAADQVGNPRVRAVATLGGALAHGDPRQDLPPVLMSLNARVHLVSPSGEREVSLDTFFHGLMETELAEDELITTIVVPRDENRVVAYSRFAPGSEDDFPTVGVAASLSFGPGKEVQTARVALSGVGPAVILATQAGEILIGSRAGEQEIAAAAAAAAAATDPSHDQRGSAAYKRAMTELWTKRTLTDCANRRP